jgi:hypothetical protein
MQSRTKPYVFGVGTLGLIYIGVEAGQIWVDPFDTKRDTAPAISVATTTSAPSYSTIIITDAIVEALRRVDMPKIPGVVDKPTKPSA